MQGLVIRLGIYPGNDVPQGALLSLPAENMLKLNFFKFKVFLISLHQVPKKTDLETYRMYDARKPYLV